MHTLMNEEAATRLNADADPPRLLTLEHLLGCAPARAVNPADAFAALLAAEQGEAPAALPTPEHPELDALLDRLSTCVAERLERTGLRDHAASVVHDVAERLVREELARLRDAAARRP